MRTPADPAEAYLVALANHKGVPAAGVRVRSTLADLAEAGFDRASALASLEHTLLMWLTPATAPLPGTMRH